MNYREVKCSDRLPGEDGWYTVWVYGKDITVETYPFEKSNKHCIKGWEDDVEKWLEPYELPTDEEIDRMAVASAKNVFHPYKEGNLVETSYEVGFVDGVQAITNLLKGER